MMKILFIYTILACLPFCTFAQIELEEERLKRIELERLGEDPDGKMKLVGTDSKYKKYGYFTSEGVVYVTLFNDSTFLFDRRMGLTSFEYSAGNWAMSDSVLTLKSNLAIVPDTTLLKKNRWHTFININRDFLIKSEVIYLNWH